MAENRGRASCGPSAATISRLMHIPAPARHGQVHHPVHRESLSLLLKVLEEHSPGVLEDLNRVAHLATATAQRLGLPDQEIERIELAARLHDVGKLAIPDEILNKPGPLDAREWVIMRTHAEVGARIVSAAPSLAHTAELVRSHHEHYDGSGYPDRLRGQAIPLGAAVIAVCAAFVAMMKHRPFSDAITVEEGLDELRRCSGSQFDPGVVDALSELVRLAVG
jgi:two-component system cell cycle response regulator